MKGAACRHARGGRLGPTALRYGSPTVTPMSLPTEPSPGTQREVVLVVDDEPIVRRLMAAALEPFYRVLEAADGREALVLFGVVGVDVAAVVTDVRMPDVDGLMLARVLGQRERSPAILFVSGFGGVTELPGPVIEKPFRPEHLLRAVQDLLAGSSRELHQA